jgi:hypothetical protein
MWFMAVFIGGWSATAQADQGIHYEVTITNLTLAQSFTPQLIVTHTQNVSLFEPGEPASFGLELLAEGGDTTALSSDLAAHGNQVWDVQTVPGLIEPGQSVTAVISATQFHKRLSMAAMLIPTNDTFMALNAIELPRRGEAVFTAVAYDAGTEENDQNCLNMPGPRCPGGEGYSPGPNVGDEGFIYVSNGFHALPEADEGEVLGPVRYDWRNPVARVVVKRL